MMGPVRLSTVLALAAENGRICPKASNWSRLYELLPDTRRDGYGFIPPAPLILGAWSETGDEQKAERACASTWNGPSNTGPWIACTVSWHPFQKATGIMWASDFHDQVDPRPS
jgi:hypothetical protein